MTDVRLVATNPADSSLVPVASNARGELAVQAPEIGKIPNDLVVEGNLEAGEATLAEKVTVGGNAVNHITLSAESNGANAATIYGRNYGAAGAPVIYVTDSTGDSKARIDNNGSLTFSGAFTKNMSDGSSVCIISDTYLRLGENAVNDNDYKISLNKSGSAVFSGDVFVGSRGKQWMLVEQGGLCHMAEWGRVSTADLVDPAERPKLRDVFQELNVIEQALGEVMNKLGMTEPDGWPVWDGSDNSR